MVKGISRNRWTQKYFRHIAGKGEGVGRVDAFLEYYYQCRNCQQAHCIDYHFSHNCIFTYFHFKPSFDISKYTREKSKKVKLGSLIQPSRLHFVPTTSVCPRFAAGLSLWARINPTIAKLFTIA